MLGVWSLALDQSLGSTLTQWDSDKSHQALVMEDLCSALWLNFVSHTARIRIPALKPQCWNGNLHTRTKEQSCTHCRSEIVSAAGCWTKAGQWVRFCCAGCAKLSLRSLGRQRGLRYSRNQEAHIKPRCLHKHLLQHCRTFLIFPFSLFPSSLQTTPQFWSPCSLAVSQKLSMLEKLKAEFQCLSPTVPEKWTCNAYQTHKAINFYKRFSPR